MKKTAIKKVEALEVLDSRGNPTVACWVTLADGSRGWAVIPSGASTGTHEALELRDGDKRRYGGKGTLKAVKNVTDVIGPKVRGFDAADQPGLDELTIGLDGTEYKERLGANAILAVSLAAARAVAESYQLELYEYLRKTFWPKNRDWWLPDPMMNVLNGGKHAIGSVDLQEFMLFPVGARSFSRALRWGAEIFHTLKKTLHEKGLPVGVGDEGGFMPKFGSHRELLTTMVKAIEAAGYKPGGQVAIALDPAASEVFSNGKYQLKTENLKLSSEELIELYQKWVKQYPIVSIEDGLAEDDWFGFKLMTEKMGGRIQIVGDDIYVTNIDRLKKGIEEKATNSVLIKLNQIGTLTETVAAIDMAHEAGMTAVVSHRSGETKDDFIADLVVAGSCGQIKTGAPARSERIEKYNRLLRIEQLLGKKAQYAKFPFKR